MSDKTRLFLLTTFFILALIWNILIPAYENLDEIEHSEVVRHLVVAGELPVHGEAEEKGFHVRQEASQPPLYYILAASWARFWKLPTDPPTATPIPETLVACGPSSTFYNKATWARDPYQDGPPWKGADLWLHGLRIFSSLLQIVTLTGTWALARRAFPRGPVPLLATAIVAFNPQFLLVSAGVNNDNLITPLATWALVLAYDLWDKGPNYQRLIGFGTLAGLAASSKLSGLGLLGLGGLIALAWTRKHIGKSAPPA
ncbi:MAG: glycosyltransferase family 39 protein, partial [Anaerolineae bacterium]|nr:glycosyltransferase family 39 protein [Anaerolineae bacterium]